MTILCVTILSLGEWGIPVFVWRMGQVSTCKSFEISGSSVQRRETMTTWGIVALAVFIAVGMGEWSKRTAADEKVISSEVMEEALKIAAARDSGVKGFRGEGISKFEIRNSKIGNEAATIQTSAGE